MRVTSSAVILAYLATSHAVSPLPSVTCLTHLKVFWDILEYETDHYVVGLGQLLLRIFRHGESWIPRWI